MRAERRPRCESDDPASVRWMSGIENVTVHVDAPAKTVYDYVAQPTHLHEWAAGLAGSALTQEGDSWIADSPMGKVSVRFTPQNDFGIFDHTVTLPSGESVLNPVRVLPDGDTTCDVIFTVRQRDMSDEEFDRDLRAVRGDLNSLKAIIERPS